MKSYSEVPEQSTSLLTNLLSVTIISLFIGSRPLIQYNNLNIHLFDIIFVLLIAYYAILLLSNKAGIIKFNLPNNISFILLTYLFLIITLPLIGLYIYHYPLHYVYEAFRWFQFIALFFIITKAYKYKQEQFFYNIVSLVKIVLLIQLLFVGVQFLYASNLLSSPLFLDFWFAGGEVGYGHLGHHISRVSGSYMNPSSLGLFSAFSAGLFFYYMFVVKKHSTNYAYFLISLVLLFASGNRISLIATLISLFVISFYAGLIGQRFTRLTNVFVSTVFASPFLYVILSTGNIGRFATDRYRSIIDIVFSRQTLLEVTGGRPQTWLNSIEYAWTEYSLFGTLASPSWVLSGTRDSYYANLLVQGGLPLFLVFIALLTVLFFYLIKSKNVCNYTVLGLNTLMVLSINCLTQNTITGFMGKFLLLIIVLSISSRKASKRFNYSYQNIELKSSGKEKIDSL